MAKRHCCKIGCDKAAEYQIFFGETPDDYTESCLEHIPELMTDAVDQQITKINEEIKTNEMTGCGQHCPDDSFPVPCATCGRSHMNKPPKRREVTGLPKSPIDTWVDRDTIPPTGRVLVAFCPEWCASKYQVCEWDGGEFVYDDQPNDMFNEHVEKWAIFYEAD